MKRTEISAGAILVLSLVFFFGGFQTLAAFVISAFVHELGHMLAIRAFGGSVQTLCMDASGLCMSYTGINEATKELITLLSGPAAGLALAYAASYCGGITQNTVLLKTAGLSFMLSVYNLLPALPLDGGRALCCLAECLFNEKAAEMLLTVCGIVSGLALCAAGLILKAQFFGIALFGAGLTLLFAQSGLVKSFGMI